MNILIHPEIGNRCPEVIINTHTLEVALAEKGSGFSNKTPEEFIYKYENGFLTILFQAPQVL